MRKLAVIAFAFAATGAFAQVWSGGGGTIIDNTTQSSTIVGVPALTGLSSIAVIGLTHTWVGDVTMRVTHINSGLGYDLVARPGYLGSGFGDSSDYAGTYVFMATGADIWAAAAAAGAAAPIPPGTYAASSAGSGAPTGLFPGAWGASDWRLDVSDGAGGDSGAWEGWEIRGNAVPEPASMIALGLGAAALLRRRKKQ